MNTYLTVLCRSLMASLVIGFALIACLSVLPTEAAAPLSGEFVPSVSTEGAEGMAPGAVEDTLKACLTRIPKNASIGQRMLAEASCERDEIDRRPIQTVPGAEYASQ